MSVCYRPFVVWGVVSIVSIAILAVAIIGGLYATKETEKSTHQNYPEIEPEIDIPQPQIEYDWRNQPYNASYVSSGCWSGCV